LQLNRVCKQMPGVMHNCFRRKNNQNWNRCRLHVWCFDTCLGSAVKLIGILNHRWEDWKDYTFTAGRLYC